jgi:hypothetical protein
MTFVNVNVGVPPQLSEPVGVPVLGGVSGDPKAIVIFGGQVITGGVLSNTVMIWEQVAEFKQASVAL